MWAENESKDGCNILCDICGTEASPIAHIWNTIVAELCEPCSKTVGDTIRAMLRTKPDPTAEMITKEKNHDDFGKSKSGR